MLRIFISGPIAGDPYYKEKFEAAEEMIKRLSKQHNIECMSINPDKECSAYFGTDIEDLSRFDFLMHDFELLDGCNFMLQLDKWENAKGCNAEWGYAIAKDIPHGDFDEFVRFLLMHKVQTFFFTK